MGLFDKFKKNNKKDNREKTNPTTKPNLYKLSKVQKPDL